MAGPGVLLLAILGVCNLVDVCRGSKRPVYPHLDSALHHYDTIHIDHLTHTITLPHPHIHHRKVELQALGRHFVIHLSPNRKIFSQDFAVYVVDGWNNRRQHLVDTDEFYHGYLQGEANSTVTAHVSKSGILTASIHTDSEHFHIEPSEDYIKEPHPFHMVAYRASDIKSRLSSSLLDYVIVPTVPTPKEMSDSDSNFKDGDELYHKSSFHYSNGDGSKSQNRLRRQTATVFRGSIGGDSCSMFLVADHKFFQQFGPEDSVIRRVVSLISDIDTMIFRPTEWTSDVQDGFGLDIANIIIHNESSRMSCSQDTQLCYNSQQLDDRNPDASDLLTAFNFGRWRGFCLAHLFTYRDFQSGLLGLANIASPVQGQTGGVCSRDFTDPTARQNLDIPANSRIIYNTGISSYNSNGVPLLRSEELLITGHEIGHNWGSHHDPPDNPQCSNQFLMFPFVQDGSSDSHRMFSPCSRSSIGAVLLSKGGCFRGQIAVCGDYRVDERSTEECDAGPDGDACCNSRCMLRAGANCSDINYACCEMCNRTDTLVCRAVRSISTDCTNSTVCRRQDSTEKLENNSVLRPAGSLGMRVRKCVSDQPHSQIFWTMDDFSSHSFTASDANPTVYEYIIIVHVDTLTDLTLDSLECPNSTQAEEGAMCFGGQCRINVSTNLSECIPQCTLTNQTRCSCDPGMDECFVCCQDSVNSPCTRAPGSIPLSNGAPCSQGACFDGMCTQGQDTISRIWTAIINLDVNTVVQFMRENIVGFVLIFMVIVWVPASCIIHFFCDSKIAVRFRSASEHTDHASWFSRRADALHSIQMWEEMPLMQYAQEPQPTEHAGEFISSPIDTGPPPTYSSLMHQSY